MPTIRKRVNDLRADAYRLKKNVEFLIMEKEDLMAEVESLKGANERLEELVNVENRGNVDELVKLVHENQSVLHDMKENLRQVVLQEVIKLVLQCDLDRTSVINKREANILATRLFLSLDVYGIVFDEQKFHRAVGLSPSLPGVMKIVKRLLPDENDRLSSFYNSSHSDSEDEDDESDDDVYDMFYVPMESEFNRGNSRSIKLCKEFIATKGERPHLMSLSTSFGNSIRCMRSSEF